MRKCVFRISDQVRFKRAYSATETSYKIEISLVASLYMILSNNKGADQTARMRRLVCAFVVRKPPMSGFLVPVESLNVLEHILHLYFLLPENKQIHLSHAKQKSSSVTQA